MVLDKYKVFNEEIKEEMVGTRGEVAIWDDGTSTLIELNTSFEHIIASTPYDCREEEEVEGLSVDYIDSLFDLLLEQVQN